MAHKCLVESLGTGQSVSQYVKLVTASDHVHMRLSQHLCSTIRSYRRW